MLLMMHEQDGELTVELAQLVVGSEVRLFVFDRQPDPALLGSLIAL